MKYKIIYADPPYEYKQKSLNRGGAARHYKTMSIIDIKRLKVREIAADDSVLFIWGTWPNLPECLGIIESWGFKYKTCAFVWVKANRLYNSGQLSFMPVNNFFMGMGHYTRSNTEFCLLAFKGKGLKRLNCGIRQIIYSPVQEHSKKPEKVREEIIKLFGDQKKIELFAREKVLGWDCWGNEVEKDIIL